MILIIKNIIGIITDPKNTRMFLVGAIVVLLMLFLRQCNETKNANGEIIRFKNNLVAASDTIRNYTNENGESVGEIKGLVLSLEELKDSLEYEHGKPPITIIKYKTIIREKIIEIPVTTKDTIIKQSGTSFNSMLSFKSESDWDNSTRLINVELPYSFTDSLMFGSATINLKQHIWLDATLSQDVNSRNYI